MCVWLCLHISVWANSARVKVDDSVETEKTFVLSPSPFLLFLVNTAKQFSLFFLSLCSFLRLWLGYFLFLLTILFSFSLSASFSLSCGLAFFQLCITAAWICSLSLALFLNSSHVAFWSCVPVILLHLLDFLLKSAWFTCFIFVAFFLHVCV